MNATMILASVTEARNGGAAVDERAYFTVRDVAEMWGQERALRDGRPLSEAKPLDTITVHRYIHASVPAKEGRKAGRYAADPPPAPTKVTARAWAWFPKPGQTMDELEKELRGWYRRRPGPGVGGGRPRHLRCPCGCGRKVPPGQVCEQELGRRKQAGGQQ